ncbi:hypothetical protein LXL04_037188 [Taraxacum kok-saghyz]
MHENTRTLASLHRFTRSSLTSGGHLLLRRTAPCSILSSSTAASCERSLAAFFNTSDSRGFFSGGFLLRLVLFPSKSHSSPPLHLFPSVGYLHNLDHIHSSNTRRFLLAASVSGDLSCSGQQPTYNACFPRRSLWRSVRRTTALLPLSLDDQTEVGFLTTYCDIYVRLRLCASMLVLGGLCHVFGCGNCWRIRSLRCFARRRLNAQGMEELKLVDGRGGFSAKYSELEGGGGGWAYLEIDCKESLQAVKDHRQPSSLPGFLHTGDSRGFFSGGFLLRLVLFPSKSHSSPPLHLFPSVGYLHNLDHIHSSNTRRFLLAASVSGDLSCSGQQPTYNACFPRRSLWRSVRRTTALLPLSLDDQTEVGFLTTYCDIYVRLRLCASMLVLGGLCHVFGCGNCWRIRSLRCFARRRLNAQGMEELKLVDGFLFRRFPSPARAISIQITQLPTAPSVSFRGLPSQRRSQPQQQHSPVPFGSFCLRRSLLFRPATNIQRLFSEAKLAEERTEDHGTTSSQLRRSDRGGFPYDILVTSHYFASVALSVRGWVGAWPESSGRCGST